MELNNITNTGTWGQQVTKLNDNFNKVALGIDTLQSAYQSLSQSAIEAVDTLPQTGEANKIYRLVGTTSYSDYMYNADDLNTPILMATYNNAIDNTPTANSANLVTSGGVAKELALGAVYDVSANNPTAGSNNDGKWESISALLSDANLNTLIPISVRKGGMSVKFVLSSDNKYVQYRLMSDSFNTTVSNWQGVDDVPTAGSDNLVKSGGVADRISELEKKTNEYQFTGLIDSGLLVLNKSIDYNDGSLLEQNYWTSNELNVKNGMAFEIKSEANQYVLVLAAYKNGVYSQKDSIKGAYPKTDFVYEVPDGVTSVRFSCSNSFKEQFELKPNFSNVSLFNDLTNVKKDFYNLKSSAFYGINLFDIDSPGILKNKLMDPNGGIGDSSELSISQYIEVVEGSTYSFNSNYPSDNYMRFITAFDADNNVISSAGKSNPTTTYTVPSGVKYIRFTFYNAATEIYFGIGQKGININPNIIKDSSIDIDKLSFVKNGENLFNDTSNDIIRNNYMTVKGQLSPTDAMSVSGCIEVEEGEKYSFESDYPNDNYMRFVTAFNEGKDVVESAGKSNPTKEYIVPVGVKYIRFTFYNAATKIMFNKGDAKAWTPYKYIPSSFIEQINIEPSARTIGMQSVRGNLSSGNQLTLDANNVKTNKSLAFVATISAFNEISVGHGTTEYGASYISIDSTTVKWYNAGSLVRSYNHGLNINIDIAVYISVKDNGKSNLRILSNGNTFEQELFIEGNPWNTVWNGSNGSIFAKADDATLTNCTLSWTCGGYQNSIQIYGDSYLGHVDDVRWAYYLCKDGFGEKCLLDGFGGKITSQALTTLLLNLKHSKPKYVFWTMGQNDVDSLGDTSATTPNASWLSATESMISACESNGIIPILCTIPSTNGGSTPSPDSGIPADLRYHKAKNDWIKASGYRYVDWASAVGANDTTGNWYDGMLSSDGVHPSAKGAITLYMQTLADFPEIMA